MTNLPKGWREVALSEVAEVTSGKTPNNLEARLAEKPRSDRNVPFYKVGDMNASPKYFDTARVYLAVDELATFGVAALPAQTVVFPKAGGAIATNKKRIMRTEGAIDLNCMAVLAKDGLHPSLLFYFFEGTDLSDLATGSVLPQIGKKTVSEMRFVLPPISEQARIVEILEEQFSRLDSALASIRLVREKAAAFRRSLLHAAFSGELTGGSKDWCDRAFGQVAKIASNLVSPEGFGSFPHLAPNHIEAQTGRLLELATIAEDGVTSPKHRFFAGQIVYSKIRPYLNKVVLVDFDGLCSADMYPIETQQNPKWLHYKMLSSEFVAAVCGSQNRTVLPKTNVRDLSAVRVAVPPLNVQVRIVEILDEQFSRLDNALEVTNQLEARIASERRSLLHAAFTGKLTANWRESYV